MSLRQSGAERFIAVNASSGILHALRGAAEDEAQVLGLALHGVVIQGEDLFVVVLPGDGVGNFVDVHQLVDEHQHTGIARLV